MRKKLLIVPAVLIYLVVYYLALGQITWITDIRGLLLREGDVTQTSYDENELMRISNRLKFLDGNTVSCKWYWQLMDKSMYEYCYDGEAVLKDEYYNTITTKYKWVEYSYAENLRNVAENDFILNPMYNSSMIRDSLQTKHLYICRDAIFSDNGTFYTFLDKESKTLYFYCWAM